MQEGKRICVAMESVEGYVRSHTWVAHCANLICWYMVDYRNVGFRSIPSLTSKYRVRIHLVGLWFWKLPITRFDFTYVPTCNINFFS